MMNDNPLPSRWERWTYWLDPLILWHWLWQPRVRFVLTWMVAVATAGIMQYVAWNSFNSFDYRDGAKSNRLMRARNDGNSGHTSIDFGGQWLMGRMLVEGHGRELYNRQAQRELLERHYPRDDESPDQDSSDAASLMGWVMGSDQVKEGEPFPIGGPLYPPINAFYFYPLGLMSPHTGYRVAQLVNLLLTFVIGFGVQRFSKGAIWCPVAAFFVMIYPGFSGTHNLGQNATLTLTLLVWGWVYIVEEKEWPAGLFWGLLAFKPVWAVCFLCYPLLTRRWRMAFSMCATGATLILLTLPFVGIDSWLHWLKVGKMASEIYDFDENWIRLSRDLLSQPRRYLLDFSLPVSERIDEKIDWPRRVIGWALLGIVFEVTIRVCVVRWRQARTTGGVQAVFLLLSCWLLCFHFMYYDALLTVLPLLLLFLNPPEYFKPQLLLLGRPGLHPVATQYYEPALAEPDNVARALLPPLPTAADEPLPFAPEPDPGHSTLLARLHEVYPLTATRGWSVWVVSRLEPILVLATIYVQNTVELFDINDRFNSPWNLYGVLLIWVYCLACWLRTRDQPIGPRVQPVPNVLD